MHLHIISLSGQDDLGQRETWIILDMGSANVRCHIVAIALISWAYNQKTFYKFYIYDWGLHVNRS